MSEQSTALTVASEQFKQELQALDTPVSTFGHLDHAQRVQVYNGLNAPDRKLSEIINEVIELQNFHVVRTEYVDDETGELREGVRITLFAADGTTYYTSSEGVLQSLRLVVDAFGTPALWPDNKLSFKVRQLEHAKGRVFKLEAVF